MNEAREWLGRRYDEQADRWPLLRTKVPKALYVRRNLRHLRGVPFVDGQPDREAVK